MPTATKATSADASPGVSEVSLRVEPLSQATPNPIVHLPTPAESQSNPSLDKDAVKSLLEIALRAHDQLEKAYDTMNVRIGAVFGFSGALGTIFVKAAEIGHPAIHAIVFSIFAFLFFGVTYNCIKAFRTTIYSGLPNSHNLTRDFLAGKLRDETVIRYETLRVVNEANEAIRPLVDEKADHFQWAVKFLLAQVVFILMVSYATAFFKTVS